MPSANLKDIEFAINNRGEDRDFVDIELLLNSGSTVCSEY